MTLQLRCGDVVAGCEGVVTGDTEQEVLTAAATPDRTSRVARSCHLGVPDD